MFWRKKKKEEAQKTPKTKDDKSVVLGLDKKPYKGIDDFIAKAPEAARPNLERVREIIETTIPDVVEWGGYGVPFYDYFGVDYVGFSLHKEYVTFWCGGGCLTRAEEEVLAERGYEFKQGSLLIGFDKEVPTDVIVDILRTKEQRNFGQSVLLKQMEEEKRIKEEARLAKEKAREERKKNRRKPKEG